MQIKTTMRYHLTPVRKATINKSAKQQVLERMWRKGNPHVLLVGMQTGAATVENSTEFPQLKMELSCDPLLGIYPEERKSLFQSDTCSPAFTTWTIATTWKQPGCAEKENVWWSPEFRVWRK